MGREIGQTLEYLNKELVRFKEERRIFAMVMLAERQRSMREAEEKGKRQEEESRRAKQDEMYRQVMSVHQGTVDSYLEGILSHTIDATAKKQAMVEANARAAFLNNVVDDLEGAGQSDEDVVKDLVGTFLLPEVSRTDLRLQVKKEQAGLLAAAHEELMASMASAGIADAAGSRVNTPAPAQ